MSDSKEPAHVETWWQRALPWILGCGAGVAFLGGAVALGLAWKIGGAGDDGYWATRGQIGDSIAPLTSMLTLAAVLLTGLSVAIQQKELSLQRQEMTRQIKELEKQAESQKAQADAQQALTAATERQTEALRAQAEASQAQAEAQRAQAQKRTERAYLILANTMQIAAMSEANRFAFQFMAEMMDKVPHATKKKNLETAERLSKEAEVQVEKLHKRIAQTESALSETESEIAKDAFREEVAQRARAAFKEAVARSAREADSTKVEPER